MKKIVALILCITMIGTILVGCNNDNDESTDTPGVVETMPTDEQMLDNEIDDAIKESDILSAFSAFQPDTLMLTIGTFEVEWAEMYFFLYSNYYMILYNFGGAFDWSEVLFDDTTIADYLISSAIENVSSYKALEYGAILNGVSLKEEDMESLQNEFDMWAEMYGGEEEFLKVLWEEDGCYDRELFEYLISISLLANRVYSELYGNGGEGITDEEAAVLVEQDGYLMAKHILITKNDEMDPEDKARTEAENVLSQLESYTGDNFDDFFDELMYMISEDTGGLMSYPEGYLFQYGDMVDEFYQAAISLDIGELSEVVETYYGYHILYRLPINFDITPYSFAMYEDYRTLREYAAAIHFDSVILEWSASLPVEQSPEFESIDITELFGSNVQ